MIKILLTAVIVLIVVVIAMLVLFPKPRDAGARFLAYQDALAGRQDVVAMDQAALREAMERFRGFWSDLTEEQVRNRLREVYAEDVWFNDTVKTIEGVQGLEEYMIETAHRVISTKVRIMDHAVSGQDVYVRWEMTIVPSGADDAEPPWFSSGMTHLRFNHEGRVVLHQDFWDPASGIYEHFPVIGGILGRLRKAF